MHRREFLAMAGATLAAGVSTQAAAQAQGWPDKPVKLILPYAPGGATDLIGIARPLAVQPELPMALLASPGTARSDFELKKIGINKLDSIADLWWTQHQVQRLGAGKDPHPTYGPRRAVLHALKRDGRNILRRRRRRGSR